MAKAICIRCGATKKSPFIACGECNFSPKDDRRAMAQSLLLSTKYFDPDTDYSPTRKELDEASRRIRSGESIDWDESTLTELILQQELLDEGEPSWGRVILFLLFILFVNVAGWSLVCSRTWCRPS